MSILKIDLTIVPLFFFFYSSQILFGQKLQKGAIVHSHVYQYFIMFFQKGFLAKQRL